MACLKAPSKALEFLVNLIDLFGDGLRLGWHKIFPGVSVKSGVSVAISNSKSKDFLHDFL